MAWIESAQASVRAGKGPFVLDGRADRDPDDAQSDFFPDDEVVGTPRDENYLGVPDSSAVLGEKLHSLPDQISPLGEEKNALIALLILTGH